MEDAIEKSIIESQRGPREEKSLSPEKGRNVNIRLKFIRHGLRSPSGELTDYGREVTRHYGLGEALVQGIVTPDRYYVDKKENVIVDIVTNAQKKMYIQGRTGGTNEVNVPKKQQSHQKLTGEQIITLKQMCQKIEKHFGSPQDIEWAIEDGKFYVLQSRPITTL